MAHVTPQDISNGHCAGICSLCGGKSAGYWGCDPTFETCTTCAVSKLPLLIADSLTYANLQHAEGAFMRMEKQFWRGVALRSMRENEELRRQVEQN